MRREEMWSLEWLACRLQFAVAHSNPVKYKRVAFTASTVHDSCSIFSSSREGSVPCSTVLPTVCFETPKIKWNSTHCSQKSTVQNHTNTQGIVFVKNSVVLWHSAQTTQIKNWRTEAQLAQRGNIWNFLHNLRTRLLLSSLLNPFSVPLSEKLAQWVRING